jgi:acetoin utilization protein AcuC
VHGQRYIDAVRAAPDDVFSAGFFGLGPGDNPVFEGMHDAAAAVAGGSLAAMERIISGEERHVFHPGGGLHHAMAERASGFCVYNDPAIAIARARRDGLRVLYVDLDVHHGDGVEAAFWDDPGVMTISLHESGRYLFPGTGFLDERGGRDAVGTKVNVPFEPATGDGDWLAALERIVPPLARRHGPDILVTQHGCDSHALDPLAHLLLTTNAYRRATVLIDQLAHELCDERWLATGGGGYDIHRVVPRSWALVWSAQAHLDSPAELPAPWRERWAEAARRRGQSPIPVRMADPAVERAISATVRERNRATLERVIELNDRTD